MNPRHARTQRPRRLAAVAVTAVLVTGAAGAALALHGGQQTPSTPEASATTTEPVTPEPTPPLSRPVPTPDPTPDPIPEPEPSPDAELTILAAGDVLPHMGVLGSAKVSGGYDFAPLLAGMRGYVEGADLALCHFEVPVVPPGAQPSGYPMFGTVPELAAALAAEGWDGCSTASNHSVDRGFPGVAATLDAFDTAGLGHVGTARSEVEAAQPQLYRLERAGQTVTVAQLSATYGTNGLPIPATQPWAVQIIDAPAVIEQARSARAAGADLVVVSMHAGVEYRSDPTPEQVALATALAESGQVDLVIGHHAHVPQPISKLPGGTAGDGMWVAYGLGNMLSNQDEACCSAATASGLLLVATVVKPADGAARVDSVEWSAVSGDRKAGHVLHMLRDAAATEGTTGTLTQSRWQARYDAVRAVVGDEAVERTEPLVPSGEPATVVPRTR